MLRRFRYLEVRPISFVNKFAPVNNIKSSPRPKCSRFKLNLSGQKLLPVRPWPIRLGDFNRMPDLPLGNISLNSVKNEIFNESDKNQRMRIGSSPLKNPLKRKSNSLGLCCHDYPKENCCNFSTSTTEKCKKHALSTSDDQRIPTQSRVFEPSQSTKSKLTSPEKENNRPFTVSIEGNIGSGKSTFLKYFASNPQVATYQEPIEEWTNLCGHNLLAKLYDDPNRWSFLFQSFVQLTRLKIHLDQPKAKSKLIERSFHNNRNDYSIYQVDLVEPSDWFLKFCFLESAHDSGNLNDSEYNVLTEYYDFFEEHMNIGIDLIVYLRTTPEIVFERMKKRGRLEESGVSLEYLQSIHKCYEQWLMESKPSPPPAPVLVINGDLDMNTLFKEYEKQLPFITGQQLYKNGHINSVINLFGSEKKEKN